MVAKAEQMTSKRSTATGRFIAAKRSDPKTGSRVKVTFGHRDATGVVVGKTITGRYNVRVEVEGADAPVTTSYSRDELSVS